MPDFQMHPILPAKPGDEPFSQRIDLIVNGKPAGSALWNTSGSADAVVQLVSLHVGVSLRRQHLATALLEVVIAQGREYFRRRGGKMKLRQLWYAVEQKSQVGGRAFLMHNNFHHVGTLPDLLKKQDLLFYKKSLV
ncbi:MAG: hypothetical protein IT448_05900 [Phycisphaerales bacterium]|nr:hypothetical protein [Phycisphaerales bacterium]